MKTLSQYLAESAKVYEFRLKTIVDFSDEQLDKLETHLRKYEAYDISAPKKTIMQKHPIDFNNTNAAEVYIIDFKTKIPATPPELVNELGAKLGVNERELKIRNRADPVLDLDETEESETPKKYKPRLTDEKYSEYKNPKADDYHGDKHLTKFMRELKKNRVDLAKEYKVKK
jgi:hypothetical protein